MYTKEQLEGMHLHDLRAIGRNIGVKSPTSKTKTELINKILAVFKGEEKPYFTKVGRKVLTNEEISFMEREQKQIDNKKEKEFNLQLSKLLEKHKKELLAFYNKHTK